MTTPQQFCFENPFPDYEQESESLLESNGQLKKSSKICTTFTKKWEATMERVRHADGRDATVYTGLAGIILLKFKFDSKNKGSLMEMKHLLSMSTKIDKAVPSFLIGATGPLALGAIICQKLGEKGDFDKFINAIESFAIGVVNTSADLANELLYGRTGYLYTLLFINQQCSPKPFEASLIRRIVQTILICGQNEAKIKNSACPLMYSFYGKYYLGAAHGISGILYMLLQCTEYLNPEELILLIKPTIDYLIKLRFPSGNFPITIDSNKDYKVQWCHGVPGFVFLFCKAYKVFGDTNYLQLALDCGDAVWKWGLLKKGYSICHGVSGNGYCFLELYQTTNNEKHLYRAVKFAEWCIDYTTAHEEQYPDNPMSLFEGVCGPTYFLLDIQKPLEAKYPGFML